jgi:hypothetical protein
MRSILAILICGLLAAPSYAQCVGGTCPLVRKPAAKAKVSRLVLVPRIRR